MRMSKYLNETVQLETQSGSFNGEGQPVFNTAETIACRKEKSGKLFRDINGREIKARNRYFAITRIDEGDLLDGEKVINSGEYKGRTGTIEGYEVYT